MKKKIILSIASILMLFSIKIVRAANELKVGDNYYDSLSVAIENLTEENKEIVLQDNFKTNSLEILNNQNVVIDLNQHEIQLIGTMPSIKNYGNLTIKNGIFKGPNNWNAIYNYKDGNLNLDSINIIHDEIAYNTLINFGKATLNKVSMKSESASEIIKNRTGGVLTLNECAITGKGIFNNWGEMSINGGDYISSDQTENYTVGLTTINGGNFHANDNDHFFKVQAPGKLVINNGNITGDNGIKINCLKSQENSLNNDCKGHAEIIINNVDLNVKKAIISSLEMTDYYKLETPIITINNGEFKSESNDYIINFGLDDTKGILNIYGGSFIANNAKKIRAYKDNVIINIGKNDGNINDKPYIYMPNGNFAIDKSNVNFYDGVLVLNNKINNLNAVADNYSVCYTKYENALKAELKTECNAIIDGNEEDKAQNIANKNDNLPENPQTGLFLPLSLLSIASILALIIYFVIKRNNKIYKI